MPRVVIAIQRAGLLPYLLLPTAPVTVLPVPSSPPPLPTLPFTPVLLIARSTNLSKFSPQIPAYIIPCRLPRGLSPTTRPHAPIQHPPPSPHLFNASSPTSPYYLSSQLRLTRFHPSCPIAQLLTILKSHKPSFTHGNSCRLPSSLHRSKNERHFCPSSNA